MGITLAQWFAQTPVLYAQQPSQVQDAMCEYVMDLCGGPAEEVPMRRDRRVLPTEVIHGIWTVLGDHGPINRATLKLKMERLGYNPRSVSSSVSILNKAGVVEVLDKGTTSASYELTDFGRQLQPPHGVLTQRWLNAETKEG